MPVIDKENDCVLLSRQSRSLPHMCSFLTGLITHGAWAAKMVVVMAMGVPWVMCKEYDAPDPLSMERLEKSGYFGVCSVINSFLDQGLFYSSPFVYWFDDFGGPTHHRPVEDLAFLVARFRKKGGSLDNYYMYHGGTNFGRTVGGPFITNNYDYDAATDEYGQRLDPTTI